LGDFLSSLVGGAACLLFELGAKRWVGVAIGAIGVTPELVSIIRGAESRDALVVPVQIFSYLPSQF
jgi:hypothetical protein